PLFHRRAPLLPLALSRPPDPRPCRRLRKTAIPRCLLGLGSGGRRDLLLPRPLQSAGCLALRPARRRRAALSRQALAAGRHRRQSPLRSGLRAPRRRAGEALPPARARCSRGRSSGPLDLPDLPSRPFAAAAPRLDPRRLPRFLRRQRTTALGRPLPRLAPPPRRPRRRHAAPALPSRRRGCSAPRHPCARPDPPPAPALPDRCRDPLPHPAAGPRPPAAGDDSRQRLLHPSLRTLEPRPRQLPRPPHPVARAAGLLRALPVGRADVEKALRAQRLPRGPRLLPDADVAGGGGRIERRRLGAASRRLGRRPPGARPTAR